MIDQFGTKHALVAAPISLAASGTLTVTTLDTLGDEYLRGTGDFGVTDTTLATLKLQQSDAANMSGPIDVPGTVVGTDNNDTGVASVLPGATDDFHRFVFQVDLRGKKRYMKLIAIASATGTAALIEAWAELSRPHESPASDAAAGITQRMVA